MSHTLTEGGQITMHRIRMLRQVVKSSFLSAILLGLVLFFISLAFLPKDGYLAAWYCFQAWLFEGVLKIPVDSEFVRRKYHILLNQDSLSSKEIYRLMLPSTYQLASEVYIRFIAAMSTSCLSAISILVFFYYRGTIAKSKTHVSGPKIYAIWWIALKLKLAKKASPIQIGGLPLVKGSETRHMLITGGTGSGKTNCMHHILRQIRAAHQKAVIVDTTGIFLQKYFNPNTDVLLNPFDARTQPWHPWAEGETPFDYADLAASFIPHSYSENENYWRSAAKSVFVSLLQSIAKTKKTSEINRWIHYETLVNLCKTLEGTKAAAHIDLSSEKTASSIRSVASTYLESLECLENTENPFSIKEWMAKKDNSWLFLQCTPAQRERFRPLLSAWISTAIRGLLALSPDLDRRVWFIIDELPTLERVKDLENLLTEGRKYGGCAVLAFQSPAQLENIYGRQTTQIITGNAATKIIFQEGDPEIAERISRVFGECEQREIHEGISYGAHETRDGVNLSTQTKVIPVVSASQILDLPPNTAYIKLASMQAIAKLKINILN